MYTIKSPLLPPLVTAAVYVTDAHSAAVKTTASTILGKQILATTFKQL